MAFIFELAAEFGNNRIAADKFRDYFLPQKLNLGDGPVHECGAPVLELDGSIWCCVVPRRIPQNGPQNIKEEKLLDEAERMLYLLLKGAILKGATGFRYAAIGYEAQTIGTFEEMKEDLNQGRDIIPGLVIADGIFGDIKPKVPLEMFAGGYNWWPYIGA